MADVVNVGMLSWIEGSSIQSPLIEGFFFLNLDGHPLVNGTSQSRLAVDNGMFSEKNALSRSTGFDHVHSKPISTIRIGIDFIVGLKD